MKNIIKFGRFAFILPYIIAPILCVVFENEDQGDALFISFLLPFFIDGPVMLLYPICFGITIFCVLRYRKIIRNEKQNNASEKYDAPTAEHAETSKGFDDPDMEHGETIEEQSSTGSGNANAGKAYNNANAGHTKPPAKKEIDDDDWLGSCLIQGIIILIIGAVAFGIYFVTSFQFTF